MFWSRVEVTYVILFGMVAVWSGRSLLMNALISHELLKELRSKAASWLCLHVDAHECAALKHNMILCEKDEKQ